MRRTKALQRLTLMVGRYLAENPDASEEEIKGEVSSQLRETEGVGSIAVWLMLLEIFLPLILEWLTKE